MTREQAIKELISVIPIGRTQNDRYIESLIQTIEHKPTLEEVRNEWEELGYEFILLLDCCINDYQILIISNASNKWIFYSDFTYEANCDEVGMREHDLLTKTFKTLGWINE